MEGPLKGTLREAVRRQGVHFAKAVRLPLPGWNTGHYRVEGQHEEQTYAALGQAGAQEKVCDRAHQRPAEEQGKPCTFQTQVH